MVRVTTDKRHKDGTPVELVLVTNRLDLDADLIALAYRYRWTVELFFRWFKCILGCRHLLSHSENGGQLQVYLALIASLLISLWVGRAPTKRTYELLCFYLSGWASTWEVLTQVERLHLTALRARSEPNTIANTVRRVMFSSIASPNPAATVPKR